MTLAIRPAQVFNSSCSAWLVGFSLPKITIRLNLLLMLIHVLMDDLMLLGIDDFKQMVFPRSNFILTILHHIGIV
jgi:hypothetical protein